MDELKSKFENLSKVNVIFTNFMISKYKKLTIQPTVIIINNNQKINVDSWLNTSLNEAYLKPIHGKVYNLEIDANKQMKNQIEFYPQRCHEIVNEEVIRAVKSKSDENLISLL